MSCLISLIGRGVVVTTGLRLGAEAQPEQRLLEGVRALPRRQLVQPQLFMLLAAQSVRLFG